MEPDQNNGGQSKAMLAGGVILILVLALFSWYLFNGSQPANTVPAPETGTAPQQELTQESDAATAALAAQGTSDDVAAIEQDLNATDLTSLSDVNKI
jgi:hypothetical protein